MGQMVSSIIMPGIEGGCFPLGYRVQVSGSWVEEGMGRPQTGERRAPASQPARPERAKFLPPTLSKGRGCLKKKRKVAELSPNSVMEAGQEGGACSLIRRQLLSGGYDWRSGSGTGKAGVGEGSGSPARGISSRRERVNFKSGTSLLLDGHAPSARPPARQTRSRRFPPAPTSAQLKDRLMARHAGSRA